jgi:6-phosphogluconolactonase
MEPPTRRFAQPVMNSRKTDPGLQVFQDRQSLAVAAAETFSAAAAEAVASRGKFLVALSGGSTPQTLFTLLAASPYQEQIAWPDTHIFWGDERLVPANDPGGNYYHARRLLLEKVPIPPSQVHRLRGELPVVDAVKDYERQLETVSEGGRSWPRFDLALMGMGADGHTASLFPGSSAVMEETRPVLSVTADYAGRPSQRITLTPPVFNDARQVLFLVAGADKAEALAAVLNGPRDLQQWPAQSIQPHSRKPAWFADVQAAKLLPPS